jgi:hypothetical protein
VGDGDAVCALDRGWEMAWAADDSGHRLQRRFGEVRWSGKEMAVGLWVRERKRECIGSSRMRFKLRRGHSE